MDLAKKLLHREGKNERTQPAQLAAELSPVSRDDIYQFRFQYGVNLGSVFVLEKWLFPSMFDKSAAGGSELEAVRAAEFAKRSLSTRGLGATIEKWEHHWASSLTPKDLDFLSKTAKCNTVRLPIGYFTLGPEFCKSTPFDGEPAKVYANAWPAVVQTCHRLASIGIGVLIDMHALPGGANKDSHSGSSSGKAELWTDHRNLELAKKVLLFVAREIAARRIENCVGLELCNEAAWAAKGMYDFFADVIKSIAAIDNSIPIYISDAWNLDKALEWTVKRNVVNKRENLVVIDTHKYYTFSEEHRSCSPNQIIERIPGELSKTHRRKGNVLNNGAAPVFIGEYSCVLDGRTWSKAPAESKAQYTVQLGVTQLQRTYERTCGSAFWTLKMNWMDGGGWGFVEMTKKGAISAPAVMRLSPAEIQHQTSQAEETREKSKNAAYDAHCSYWDNTSPGKTFEHWRFAAGWDDGWRDANAFFTGRQNFELGQSGGDTIGSLDAWVLKRLRELAESKFQWEWEHGFRVGVSSAEQVLLGGLGAVSNG